MAVLIAATLMLMPFVLCCFGSGGGGGGVVIAAARSVNTTTLDRWPMIMAHDAATTYLKGGALNVVDTWAKTQQDGGAAGLLLCGARAFDWRPALLSNGTVIMHHGGVHIDHTMASALDEMVRFAGTHTLPEDLIFLGITGIEGGDKATLAVQSLLKARGIQWAPSCDSLKGMTVAQAATKYRLPGGGGAILAAFGCWAENYDPTVACSGYHHNSGSRSSSSSSSSGRSTNHGTFLHGGGGETGTEVVAAFTKGVGTNVKEDGKEEEEEYTCYNGSSTQSVPLSHMWSYINKTANIMPPGDGQLYTTQCIWQESTASVVIGELHGSSLLEDEVRSGLNWRLANRILSGQWPNPHGINMIEINNVCDGGPYLLSALRTLE